MVSTVQNITITPRAQIAFCPADPSLLSAVGDGFLRLYRATEAALKQLPTSLGRRDPQPYPCHAWLVDLGEKAEKDRCVVASAGGEVLLVEGGEVRFIGYRLKDFQVSQD